MIGRIETYDDDPYCQLFLADCNSVMQSRIIPKVDVIVADPPYGVGKAEWDGSFPKDWIEEAWKIADRMIVMVGNTTIPEALTAIDRYKDITAMHATNGMTKGPISFGNWFPAIHFGDWKWGERQNHISFAVDTRENIRHPSPKPLAAMLKLIKQTCDPEWTIFDPFMGSGTTGVAATLLKRKFVGSEIDPGYFEESTRRIEAARRRLMNGLFYQEPAAVQEALF